MVRHRKHRPVRPHDSEGWVRWLRRQRLGLPEDSEDFSADDCFDVAFFLLDRFRGDAPALAIGPEKRRAGGRRRQPAA